MELLDISGDNNYFLLAEYVRGALLSDDPFRRKGCIAALEHALRNSIGNLSLMYGYCYGGNLFLQATRGNNYLKIKVCEAPDTDDPHSPYYGPPMRIYPFDITVSYENPFFYTGRFILPLN